ncbi:hypothetical protein [Cyclobacterium marinum]|uniref:Uncharacterized protein n=1 Tax=Cyclobacterium marinum (strain ATCC 25205 / DSM 745 / LMG 13164 / NCIMB 1802) TaxID=880070 RepID=G0J5Q7_CYCMS|nr:hypothetical protein [Cyclobacterium marinum]AEL25358.1 hypothetical protein Cycma_1603 [Cyclobacterium marinum DSM 745]
MKPGKNKLILLVLIALLIGLIFGYFKKEPKLTLKQGNIEVPQKRSIQWNNDSEFKDSIIGIWVKKKVEYGPKKGKVSNPRVLLARLHSKTNIQETNQIIMGMKPWGVSGSSWFFNKLGDYDFTFTVLTTILWQFGDNPEILYKETVNHLLEVLLTEEGNKFRRAAPKTFGLFPETENHILMTEGSRYLKNRWLAIHGNDDPKYDNTGNGMEAQIMDFLHDMKTNGLHEFNSMPYIGYTITALLNLEAFASQKVRKEARDVLDYMNISYALGSYHYKYFPPMRRRYERASWHKLTTGYHSVFMKAWMSFFPGAATNFDIGEGEAHAIIGACMPYRPADKIRLMLSEKGNGYFIKMGHGKGSCPEIYTAGENYLLSAGGANLGKTSQIVARPITLFLNDEAKELEETFHLAGPGTNFMEWNNTGVYKNFACAAGPVAIPQGYQAQYKGNIWSIFEANDKVLVAVFSSANLGILLVFENQDPQTLLKKLENKNPDMESLHTQFRFPDGLLIEYDPIAPKDKWVITKVNQSKLDRNYENWPLIEGSFYP